MIGALFGLSVGFFAYTAYALVSDLKGSSRVVVEKKAVTRTPSKPQKTNKTSKTTTTKKTVAAKKTKPKAAATATKKAAPKSSPASDAIVAYLGKNGLTTVAKLNRELPGGKKAIQDSIDQLIRDGKLAQSTVGRAKAINLKA